MDDEVPRTYEPRFERVSHPFETRTLKGSLDRETTSMWPASTEAVRTGGLILVLSLSATKEIVAKSGAPSRAPLFAAASV